MKTIKIGNVDPGEILIGEDIEISEALVKRIIKENPEGELIDCDCISYNQPEESQKRPEKIMAMLTAVLPDGTKQYKDILVDFCIADDIQKLWDNGIFTLNSCCGHKKKQKSVVIASKSDSLKAKRLLPDFEICYWDLIRSNTNIDNLLNKFENSTKGLWIDDRDSVLIMVQQALETVEKSTEGKIFNRVHFMRQWLNEDRICKGDRFVTSDMLIDWLSKDLMDKDK